MAATDTTGSRDISLTGLMTVNNQDRSGHALSALPPDGGDDAAPGSPTPLFCVPHEWP
jgi:hypothetical protein